METQRSHPRPIGRREFFSTLSIAWLSLALALSSLIGLIFRYTFPNVNFEPDTDVYLGNPKLLSQGVNETWKNTHGVWVVRDGDMIFALSTICTHLGCIPNWTPSSQTFECPCHGSGYYASGINFKGPAPRPLERYAIKREATGDLVVDKTKVFRQEKNQWSLPGSYVIV